jgi:hypothetical protein
MTLLLQSPIRCCDKPAAGGLAPQTFDVLHEYASDPPGSARRSFDLAQDGEPVEPSHDAAWRFRHEQS